MEKQVITIVGPTCSGKTYLSLIIAKEINSEIISADSRQVFRYLNIGTAKPPAFELKSVKHHFINKINPDEYYNVSMFETEAFKIIDALFKKGKTPIIVGGSGLYIKTLIDGIFDAPDPDFNLREKLIKLHRLKGNEFLYNELKKVDPSAASNMLPQNWKRVMRALEVFYNSGVSIVKLQKLSSRKSTVKFVQYGLKWERDVLYSMIEKRVDKMIMNGLVKEVKSLLDKGYSPELNSLNTVGYKEIIAYLKGEVSLERSIGLIKRNTRRFAKRQMTWFKADKRIKWYQIKSIGDLDNLAEEIITSQINKK